MSPEDRAFLERYYTQVLPRTHQVKAMKNLSPPMKPLFHPCSEIDCAPTWCKRELPQKRLQQLSRTDSKQCIDLHQHTLHSAIQALERFIVLCLNKQCRELIVVHADSGTTRRARTVLFTNTCKCIIHAN